MNAASARVLTPPVKMDVPDFDGLTISLGASREHYLSREKLGDWYGLSDKTPFHKAASSLFYKGGKLSDHGLTIKAGLNSAKVHGALRALLCSFDPSHEIKIGTVAVALANWCDYAKTEAP